jgi:hypothetical protein
MITIGKKNNNYFLIPRLGPFSTLKTGAVRICGFTRCVDWGFHKKMTQKSTSRENRGLSCVSDFQKEVFKTLKSFFLIINVLEWLFKFQETI